MFDLDDPGLLFADDVLADPRPLYDELRRRAPVWQVPGTPIVCVSDPDLVKDVVARPAEFSSNLVAMVHRGPAGNPALFEMLPYGDPSHALATADPPAHSRHRRVLQAVLSPESVSGIEVAVRSIVDRQLDGLLAAGSGDVVALLGDVVPAATVCHLLGLPLADVERLAALVVRVGRLLDGVVDEDGMIESGTAALELARYGDEQLAAARDSDPAERTPTMQALVDAADLGELTPEEATSVLLQLFTAGVETTGSLIATAIGMLSRDEARQAELRRGPDGIPAFLEEVLRADGPFQFHYRYVPVDTELGDTTIPAGSVVCVMWAAANRELEPPTDARRPPHFAFGRGIHFCIGAALARMESRVVVEQLLARTASVAPDPVAAPTRRPSIFVRRHGTLPVVVRPS